LVSEEIEINLVAVDEASSVIADASDRINEGIDEVSASNQELASSVNETLAPLSASERAQLNAAAAAVDLVEAEQRLKDATVNLNESIKETGVESESTAQALREVNDAQEDVNLLQKEVASSTRVNAASMRELTVGLSGVATAAFSLYNAFDRVSDMQLQVDRANLQVKSSADAVEDAKRRLNAAYASGDEEKVTAATNDLRLAQERNQLATERAQQVQDNMNEAMFSSALQVIPTTITMVDSLSRAWKNFPDMTGVLKALGSNVSDVGNKATLAAIGVTSFVGGFTLGYTVISQFGDALGPVGRALMVVVPAIIAAAAAVWMLQEGLTLGVATAALIASGVAVGAMVANLQGYGSVIGLASGGVTQGPTYALIGEAGPEIVMPLDRYEAQRASSDKSSSYQQQLPRVLEVKVTQQFYGDINSPEYIEEAAQKTVDKLNEKLQQWR
jgi:hypothetical protein